LSDLFVWVFFAPEKDFLLDALKRYNRENSFKLFLYGNFSDDPKMDFFVYSLS